MKITTFILVASSVVIIAACSSSKKSTSSTASSNNTVASSNTNTTTTSNNKPEPKPVYFNPNFNSPEAGIKMPGDNEVAALLPRYSDVTIDKLKEGYFVYTGAACTGCHGAKNIQSRPTERWKGIIDKMSEMAKISESQRDAVYKYVLAVKATQTNEPK